MGTGHIRQFRRCPLCLRRHDLGPASPPLLTAARVALKLPPDSMAETLSLRGELQGHTGWVTSIATPLDPNSDTVLSSSR